MRLTLNLVSDRSHCRGQLHYNCSKKVFLRHSYGGCRAALALTYSMSIKRSRETIVGRRLFYDRCCVTASVPCNWRSRLWTEGWERYGGYRPMMLGTTASSY